MLIDLRQGHTHVLTAIVRRSVKGDVAGLDDGEYKRSCVQPTLVHFEMAFVPFRGVVDKKKGVPNRNMAQRRHDCVTQLLQLPFTAQRFCW